LQVTQATLRWRRWFHFFPMATARCNADEQIFIFAPEEVCRTSS
jgi:hypothetical protein